MGKEREGQTRVNMFFPDNVVLQMKESAYLNRQSVTAYILEAVIKRIKEERSIINKKNKEV